MYQESGTLSMGGSQSGGAYNNPPTIPSSQAKNFVYFGLPAVTSVSLKGSPTFIGVIYAPEADVSLDGGGSSNDFMGSLIARSITMKGHYQIHYDTSLAGYFYGYYVVGSWAEL
jgi:choice-of-anchor A domain-containing protein